MGMGARSGGKGALATMEFEKDDVICCLPVKIFARAFGARYKNPYM